MQTGLTVLLIIVALLLLLSLKKLTKRFFSRFRQTNAEPEEPTAPDLTPPASLDGTPPLTGEDMNDSEEPTGPESASNAQNDAADPDKDGGAKNSQGLSLGAKILIAIGVIVGLVLLRYVWLQYAWPWLKESALAIWTLPIWVNWTYTGNGFWASVGFWLKVLVLAYIIDFLIAFVRIYLTDPGKTETDSPAPKSGPLDYQNRKWGGKWWFIVPPKWCGIRITFGKPGTVFGPGFHWKLGFGIQQVIFIDQRATKIEFTTDEVPTAFTQEIMRNRYQFGEAQKKNNDGEKDKQFPIDKQSLGDQPIEKKIGPQASFDIQFLMSIHAPMQMLDYDEKVRTPGSPENVAFVRAKLNNIVRSTLNYIPFKAGYHLPSLALGYGEAADIIGDPSKGEDPERFTAANKKFEDIDPDSPESAKRASPKSFIGQLHALGFTVRGFTIEDFNPEEKTQANMDKMTEVAIDRELNITQQRKRVDTADAEAAIRETQTIGSARTISRLLKTLKEDLAEMGIKDFNPTSEQVMQLIPLMEHYRTVRLSKAGDKWLLDFSRYIPNLDQLFQKK